MIRGGATLLAFCALTIQGIAPARGQTAVDVELVIAVDSSASIDEREFALQLAGIAAAFRDPEVVTAIGSGPRNRVAVMAIFWAESGYPSDTTPWHVLADAADAERFARLMERWPRRVEGGANGASGSFGEAAEIYGGGVLVESEWTPEREIGGHDCLPSALAMATLAIPFISSIVFTAWVKWSMEKAPCPLLISLSASSNASRSFSISLHRSAVALVQAPSCVYSGP